MNQTDRPLVVELPSWLLELARKRRAEVVISARVIPNESLFRRGNWRVEVRDRDDVLCAGEGQSVLEAGMAALIRWQRKRPDGPPAGKRRR